MMQTKLWQADSVAVLMPPAKKGIRNRVLINICERLHHSFAAAFAGARPDCPFGSDGRLKIRVLPFAPRPQAFRLRPCGQRVEEKHRRDHEHRAEPRANLRSEFFAELHSVDVCCFFDGQRLFR